MFGEFNTTIVGQPVLSVRFAQVGELAEKFKKPELKYVCGTVVELFNGWLIVSGGGSRSSVDYVDTWLLSSLGVMLASNEMEQ
jgi:hypothetical protein